MYIVLAGVIKLGLLNVFILFILSQSTIFKYLKIIDKYVIH